MKIKCEKCKASEHLDRMGNPIWNDSTAFKCESYFFHGEKLIQSDLCRARCKVAKLKRQVNKLKERVEVAELAESALRNSNYVYNY